MVFIRPLLVSCTYSTFHSCAGGAVPLPMPRAHYAHHLATPLMCNTCALIWTCCVLEHFAATRRLIYVCICAGVCETVATFSSFQSLGGGVNQTKEVSSEP